MLLNAQLISAKDCSLQDNCIDIWEFPLDELPPLASSFLNETELTRANRYYFDQHRRRFTVARASLRLILGLYIKQEARQLTFSYNDHGKPKLDNLPTLEFNLSHSGELALLAVGQNQPLGIDLEFFSERPYDGIAKNLFSPQELALFLPLPSWQKPQVFFHIWAQKEAFIKASGLGLAYPTALFTVPLYSPAHALVNDSVHHRDWLLESFMPKVGCNAALCHHPEIQTIRYIRVDKAKELFN
ncbi:4'-phosphopantetheinyl transferase sfp [Legionella massiliensis]|uniref:4'-phosphopantetheinyl transferase sfp n=1 Tax=Legionella massiliensis TaxID=1034943 RepID=A0A078L3W1_9GAMM|nr:4'-phosphopantetheinyl transferase superfamily protein [Legionella massiliensis]CDZ78829.1 4'-phosphopantetheinyl transferase sfp [Legionella massiliensis]CEE14567.1 4'-phosphopantetheinyl transferase sfp [Legionella massiliensis]